MRKSISYSKHYNENDFQNKLTDCVIPLVEKNDFWWQEVINFYLGYYEYQLGGEEKKHLYFKDLEGIMNLPYFPIEAKDKGGNTLSNALVHIAQKQGNQEGYRFLFFENDYQELLELTKNALDYNNGGENAFWGLNTIMFSLAQPDKKLTPLIEKHNINIFHKNKEGKNLLDSAIYDKNEYLAQYYIDKGLQMTDPFANFIFHRNISQKGIFCNLFKEQMIKHNVFTHKLKKANHEEVSIIDLWITFSNDNSKDYQKNLRAVIRYHMKEKPKHVSNNDIYTALESIVDNNWLKAEFEVIKAEFEKQFLNEKLEKTNKNTKISKI